MEDAAKLVAGVKFLLKGWIPFGMITGIVAEPGVGKSAFTLYGIVRPILTGCDWFDNSKGTGKPGCALWCGTENDIAITIDRMKKWGVPAKQLLLPFKDDPLMAVNLTDSRHLERIEAIVEKYKPRAVVVDSLRGGHDGDENNSRVGSVMQALSGMAERTRTAVIVVHHTKKLMVDEEITANSSRGSNAILAMMRSQIGIDRPDPESKSCRVRVLKENLGIRPTPVGFDISETGLLFGSAPERPHKEKSSKRLGAEDWLRMNMVPGQWYPSQEVERNAAAFEFKGSTLQRAMDALCITQEAGNKVKEGKVWKSRLPATRAAGGGGG